jgi:DNA-binding transcriptional LysR family regulator
MAPCVSSSWLSAIHSTIATFSLDYEPVEHNPLALADLPLAALATFECVARRLHFSRAAEELRVTPTAVSKTIAQLEAYLGARLLHRTTRSVALTEAGTQLAAATAPALAALAGGVEDVRGAGDEAAGTLRVSTSYVAYTTLLEPHLRGFFAAYPRVTVELSIDSAPTDIVGRGFDIGIRPGRAVKQDMVAVALGPVQRLVVVAAPGYLARAGRPRRPADLLAHACIRQRLAIDGRLLEWTLRRGKERRTLDVTGPLVLDDMRAVLGAARADNGLAYVFEHLAAPDLASGALERVLPDHELVREAFFLYYPSRAQLPRKLRAFIDWFRDRNEPAPARVSRSLRRTS